MSENIFIYTDYHYFFCATLRAAEVVVKLRNQGQDAYKADQYGKSIIVERRLTREGSTSYKLKSDDGEFKILVLIFCFKKWFELKLALT